MDSQVRRGPAFGAIAVLVLVVVLLQLSIDPTRASYRAGESPKEALNTPKELFGGALLGFREAAAGLLWVKADDYFHSGKYEEIVPLFYIVTWLDPHQLEVYSTGAWHLAYNLGDQRLIPEAVKFLHKGIRDNPTVYDMYFQLAWLYYHKIRNYPEALRWGRIAESKRNSDATHGAPPYWVPNFVCHMLERCGRVEEARAKWKALVDESERKWNQRLAELPESTRAQYRVAPPSSEVAFVELATRRHNYEMNILRQVLREHVGQPGYRFQKAEPGNPLWVPSGDNRPHPIQVNLNFKAQRIGPRRLKITGTMDMPDWRYENHENFLFLTVTLRDKDYDKRYAAHADDFQWQKDNLTTYSKEVAYPSDSKNRKRFETEMDLSVDPMDPEGPRDPKKLFPLKAEEYELTVFFDPWRQGPYVQDGLGWHGEGFTDPSAVIDNRGIRVLKKTIILKREQIL